MLKVAIHHGEVRRARGEHTFDHGGAQAAASDALKDADAAVALRHLPRELGGAIGRIVVDEQDFEIDAGEDGFQTRHQGSKVLALVKRGNHDGEFGHSGPSVRAIVASGIFGIRQAATSTAAIRSETPATLGLSRDISRYGAGASAIS